MAGTQLLCVGEALIDVNLTTQPVSATVGGSILNVANGCSRLGIPTALASHWGDDDYGKMIEEKTAAANLKVLDGTITASKTSIAKVTLDQQRNAKYDFDLEWDLSIKEKLDRFKHLHTGSLASAVEPGASKLLDIVNAASENMTISYDPNVRPAILGSPAEALAGIEKFISYSTIVKASNEDIAWLYPRLSLEEVVTKWLNLGASLVVATLGNNGAFGRTANMSEPVKVNSAKVSVVDTIGAGDSFMAGLISALWQLNILGNLGTVQKISNEQLAACLSSATKVASVTVAHQGAYAPTKADLD